MPKLRNVLLTLSLIGFAIGFSNAQPLVYTSLGLPLGAVLFALFLICTYLDNEAALYDEQKRSEEAAWPSSARQPNPGRPEAHIGGQRRAAAH